MNQRVGHIEFANCLPLYYGLDKSGILPSIDLVKGKPTALAKMLMTNDLDMAPIPSIEYARNYKELTLLPDISVSSDGEVKSILLVSKEPLERLSGKKLALTCASATSQVLLKIIMREKYGVRPYYYESLGDPDKMLNEATGALIIGDEALKLSKEHRGLFVYDLGIEWKEMTDLKMVYAVWAIRDSFIKKEPEKAMRIDEAFRDSIQHSKQCLAEVTEFSSLVTGLPVEYLKKYFDALRFDFDEPYRKGLMFYYEKAHKYGYLEEVPELKFLSSKALMK